MVAAREMPPASICLGFLASRTAADTASVLSICDLGLLHDVCKTSFMFDALIETAVQEGKENERQRSCTEKVHDHPGRERLDHEKVSE